MDSASFTRILPRLLAQNRFGYLAATFPQDTYPHIVDLPLLEMLKKATSGVLALLPCSRTGSTLRAPKRLWPCWMTFLTIPVSYRQHNFLQHLRAMFEKYPPLLLPQSLHHEIRQEINASHILD